MTRTTTQDPQPQDSAGARTDAVDEQLAAQLVAQARVRGISLVGPDGLLQQLTKLVLEGALEGELTDHLGYQHGDPAGRNGGNSRNGTRAKTVRTEIGPVELEVPRDRDASFQPQIVRKRQRRLGGVEDLVVSLVAKGLTTGEVQAHLAEVYGTDVSRQTISTITDRVLRALGSGMAFDAEIRTVICTTNAIESVNARFRRSVKARGHFPGEQAALKHLYLTVLSLDPTGRGRRPWSNRWKAALNAFDITFDGRLSTGRK